MSAAIELVRRTCVAQGLPERVEDLAVIDQVAAMLSRRSRNNKAGAAHAPALSNCSTTTTKAGSHGDGTP